MFDGNIFGMIESGDPAHDLLGALDRLAVEARDQVAGPDAGVVGGALQEDIDHRNAAARDDAELRRLLVAQILRHESEPAAHHMAVRENLLRDAAHQVHGNRETDALGAGAAVRGAIEDRRVDADQRAARVDERAAELPRLMAASV